MQFQSFRYLGKGEINATSHPSWLTELSPTSFKPSVILPTPFIPSANKKKNTSRSESYNSMFHLHPTPPLKCEHDDQFMSVVLRSPPPQANMWAAGEDETWQGNNKTYITFFPPRLSITPSDQDRELSRGEQMLKPFFQVFLSGCFFCLTGCFVFCFLFVWFTLFWVGVDVILHGLEFFVKREEKVFFFLSGSVFTFLSKKYLKTNLIRKQTN